MFYVENRSEMQYFIQYCTEHCSCNYILCIIYWKLYYIIMQLRLPFTTKSINSVLNKISFMCVTLNFTLVCLLFPLGNKPCIINKAIVMKL